MYSKLAAISAFVATVKAQAACTLNTETKPSLSWSTCTSAGSCASTSGQVVIDSNWRWVHDVNSSTNCYTGNTWSSSVCSTDATCTTDCCLDGATYQSTYGVTTSGNALTLQFVTNNSNGKNIGSRLYLMASETEYEMFTLLGKEFTFDVDVSKLPVSRASVPCLPHADIMTKCRLKSDPVRSQRCSVLCVHGCRRWHVPVPYE